VRAPRYDVALSYARGSRELAAGIAADLGGDFVVFLDRNEAAGFWGSELLDALPARYLDARLCLLLITGEYLERFWTGFEREMIVSEVLARDPRGVLGIRMPGCAAPLTPELEEATIPVRAGTEREEIVRAVRARLGGLDEAGGSGVTAFS
jgi:hypothetical protein